MSGNGLGFGFRIFIVAMNPSEEFVQAIAVLEDLALFELDSLSRYIDDLTPVSRIALLTEVCRCVDHMHVSRAVVGHTDPYLLIATEK